MVAPDGKKRLTQAATMKGILRIVQSIPSKKAEPLKQWLAEIGSQRIDQMIDRCARPSPMSGTVPVSRTSASLLS